MSVIEICLMATFGVAVFALWVRLMIWIKLKDIERRQRRDALIALHLSTRKDVV